MCSIIYIVDKILVVDFLSKVTISVLVIWVAIGVSLATIYPLIETIEDLETNIRPGNLQPSTDTENMQNGSGSGNLQTNNISTNNISDNSRNDDAVNDEPNNKPGIGSGNKYLVNNFILNIVNFTAEITNPQNRVIGPGFFEIKTNPAANHKNVLQNGTFSHSNGTFTINYDLEFTPVADQIYYILVYSNYPEQNNRLDKDNDTYNP